MLAKETGAGPNFDLPEEVLQYLPSDPFEQLDVARKITSLALSTRVSALETELSVLQHSSTEKDDIISDLQSQLETLDSSLSETSDKLAQAEQDKEILVKENASLASTVRKLNRDVAKLQTFRKTLMRSLEEEEDNAAAAASAVSAPRAAASNPDDDSTSRTSSITNQTHLSDTGNSHPEEDNGTEALKPPRVSAGLLLASQSNTPRLTPPGSPPSLSASASPRRHSVSFSSTRGMFDDNSRSSFSIPPSQYSSMPGYDTAAQSGGRTRVDGKEFFRQVRSRLSYEQFGAFLANVKDLNSHKQTREETLRKAEEIFGSDNKDMFAIFEGLITRNVH